MPGKPARTADQLWASQAAQYQDAQQRQERVVLSQARPTPRPQRWQGNDNLGRQSSSSAVSLSEALSNAQRDIGPGRYLPPRHGGPGRAGDPFEPFTSPTPAPSVVRPPVPARNPRHDYTAWARQHANGAHHTLEDLLGREHFEQPKPAPVPVSAEAKLNAHLGKHYRIGAVAKRFGRSPKTIRAWIQDGTIPEPARMRGPSSNRYWTGEQLDALADIADECGVLSNLRCPLHEFSARVYSEIDWSSSSE